MIDHVMQPTLNTCMATCISMCTGLNLQEIIDNAHHKYIAASSGTLPIYFEYLKSKGVPFDDLESIVGQEVSFETGYYYILCTPSPNTKGMLHAVVLDCSDCEEEWKILDPLNGWGLKYYSWDDYPEDQSAICINDLESLGVDFRFKISDLEQSRANQ